MSILDPELLGVPACVCGRLSTKIHCPHCGAYTLYALASKKTIKINPTTGIQEDCMSYRCKRCGKYFDDYDWQFDNCHAPLLIRKGDAEVRKSESIIQTIGTRKFNNSEMEFMMERARKLKLKLEGSKAAINTASNHTLHAQKPHLQSNNIQHEHDNSNNDSNNSHNNDNVLTDEDIRKLAEQEQENEG